MRGKSVTALPIMAKDVIANAITRSQSDCKVIQAKQRNPNVSSLGPSILILADSICRREALKPAHKKGQKEK